MKKFYKYDDDDMKKEIVYCTSDKVSSYPMEAEQIIKKGLLSEHLYAKFNKKIYKCINGDIKNDDNLFITLDQNDDFNVWQVCGRVSDYNGTIIPDTYYIRKVGFIIGIE